MATTTNIIIDLSIFPTLNAVQEQIKNLLKEHPQSFIKINYNNPKIWVEILGYIFEKRTLPFFEDRVVPYEWSNLREIINLLPHLENLSDVSIKQIRTRYQKDYSIIPKFSCPPSDKTAIPVITGLNAMKETIWISLDIAVTHKPDYCHLAKYLDIPTYSSGRPKTSMPFLGHPKDMVLETSMIKVEHGIFQYGPDYYAPVLRYAEGMSGGYYGHAAQNTSYGGTFYYIEFDEDRYLKLGTFRIFRNKFSAYLELKQSFSDKELNSFLDPHVMEVLEAFDDPTHVGNGSALFACAIDEIMCEHDDEYNFSPDMIVFQRQLLHDYMIEGKKITNSDGTVWYDPETNYNWTGQYSNFLYADEDRFDQTICDLAKRLNIDCIILTHMAGGSRVVSELLDTRERETSYGSIVRVQAPGK